MEEQRIGEAVIQNVIQTDAMDAGDFQELPPVALNSDQERMLVTNLCNMIRAVGESVKNDTELQSAIDAVAECDDSRWERFLGVTDIVLQDGITWERIAVLIYVAGKLASKLARKWAVNMVESYLPQRVRDVLKWTKDFFRTNLLDWILDHGGWINGLTELTMASVRIATSLTSSRYSGILILIAGVALGSFITWKAGKRL